MWSKDAPTEKGFYYFYGYPFGMRPDDTMNEARLLVVECWVTNGHVDYVGLGVFLETTGRDAMKGYWKKLPNPEPLPLLIWDESKP